MSQISITDIRTYPSVNLRDMEEDGLEELGRGAKACRYNLSHLPKADLLEEHMRIARGTTGKPVLPDFQGPKIRIGEIENRHAILRRNQMVEISPSSTSRHKHIPFLDEEMMSMIRPEMYVLLDDNKIRLRVLESRSNSHICQIMVGGNVRSRVGIYVPEIELPPRPMPKKDEQELVHLARLAKQIDEDFIEGVAVSFVEHAADIAPFRQALPGWVKIISKIENKRGARNIDSILEASDEIVIARGDGSVVWGYQLCAVESYIAKKVTASGKRLTVATGLPISLEIPERQTLTQSEASAVYYHIHHLGVTGFWLPETANSDRPHKIVAEFGELLVACFQDPISLF